jgi:hypothetical protein
VAAVALLAAWGADACSSTYETYTNDPLAGDADNVILMAHTSTGTGVLGFDACHGDVLRLRAHVTQTVAVQVTSDTGTLVNDQFRHTHRSTAKGQYALTTEMGMNRVWELIVDNTDNASLPVTVVVQYIARYSTQDVTIDDCNGNVTGVYQHDLHSNVPVLLRITGCRSYNTSVLVRQDITGVYKNFSAFSYQTSVETVVAQGRMPGYEAMDSRNSDVWVSSFFISDIGPCNYKLLPAVLPTGARIYASFNRGGYAYAMDYLGDVEVPVGAYYDTPYVYMEVIPLGEL